MGLIGVVIAPALEVDGPGRTDWILVARWNALGKGRFKSISDRTP